jgi:putative membrane protein
LADQPREVDYRFILANERTFLAWMRTSLGLIAGGVALDQFVAVGSGSTLVRVIALIVIAMGAGVSIIGVLQWHRADAAMFDGRPMARSRVVPILGIGLVAVAIGIAIALILDSTAA